MMGSSVRLLARIIFLVEDGRLYTPSLGGPLLPGIMRRVVVEVAGQAGVEIEETSLPVERIKRADEAFLTNSVRGIVPVAQLVGAKLEAPGRMTRQLWNHVLRLAGDGGMRASVGGRNRYRNGPEDASHNGS